jgi:hypothetical protein
VQNSGKIKARYVCFLYKYKKCKDCGALLSTAIAFYIHLVFDIQYTFYIPNEIKSARLFAVLISFIWNSKQFLPHTNFPKEGAT